MATGFECVFLVTTADGFAQALGKRFGEYNYAVTVLRDAAGVIESARRTLPVVILVDRQLRLIEQLRREPSLRKVAIVVVQPLAGAASSEEENLECFERGADACLCAQSYPELVARVRSIIRRQQLLASSRRAVYRVGALSLDADRHEVEVGGKPVDLTPKEFQLLHYFMQHPSRVFARDELLNLVWGEGIALEEHNLDVHIHALRRKIESDPANPRFIQTVRGVGYKLRPES